MFNQEADDKPPRVSVCDTHTHTRTHAHTALVSLWSDMQLITNILAAFKLNSEGKTAEWGILATN